MAKMKLNLSFEKSSLLNIPVARNIQRCVEATLDAEGITALCEINVLVTDDVGIHGINLASRNIDRPTDVLSFPMFELEPGNPPADWEPYKDPGTNAVPWAIWSSPWSGQEPRPRSSATASSGRWAI